MSESFCDSCKDCPLHQEIENLQAELVKSKELETITGV